MFVEWSKELETGVAFVDADHKVLVNLLNQVNQCVVEHEESTVIGSVLEALVEYTDYHFMREEKMLELVGYEALPAHQKTHSRLSNQVREIYTNYQSNPWKVEPTKVQAFLKSWLVDHIMVHDLAYRDMCLNNEKATASANEVQFINNSDSQGFSDWVNVRVMLVDDNPNFRRLIQTILKVVGVRHLQVVDCASKGIAKLSQRPTDVVLCDMVMDEMSGAEFAHQLQQMNLDTSLIMMTGFSKDDMKERCADFEVAGYLEKPIKARQLLETIARAALKAR